MEDLKQKKLEDKYKAISARKLASTRVSETRQMLQKKYQTTS
jgi:hypothetical protein